MEHARYRELLERHLDGDLGAAERDELFEHLENCEECRQILEAEQRLAERLGSIPRLVAPSDLRANILKEAVREREQMMHALDEESRYAKAVRGPGKEEEDEEFPFFAGSDRSRGRSRVRAFWVRYSPAAAVAFAVVAAVAALMTSDFGSDGPLAAVQATVRTAARTAGSTILAVAAPSSMNRLSTEESLAATASHPTEPTRVEIARKDTSLNTRSGRTVERTGVEAAMELPESVAGHARTVRAVVHQMARAASDSLPEPAEQANPLTEAIVVQAPTSREVFSLDPDDFGSSLRITAETRLGGSLTGVNQFAFEGRRYRCYTLRVSASLFEHFVESMKTYRAPSDNTVLRVFRDQGYNVSDSEGVVFFAASGDQFRTAAHAVREDPAPPGGDYRDVKIFVVE